MPTPITATNPFMREYAWGRSTLIDYKNKQGVPLQATLLYPAGYVPWTQVSDGRLHVREALGRPASVLARRRSAITTTRRRLPRAATSTCSPTSCSGRAIRDCQ